MMNTAFPDAKLNPMLSVPLDNIAANEDDLLRALIRYRGAASLS